jgi:hypothetical protein
LLDLEELNGLLRKTQGNFYPQPMSDERITDEHPVSVEARAQALDERLHRGNCRKESMEHAQNGARKQ